MAKTDEFVQECLKDAEDLRTEKITLQEKISANRDLLRNLAKLGKLNKKEQEYVNEMYPPRQKADDDTETAPEGTPQEPVAA